MNSRQIKTILVDDESRIRRGIERLVLSCGDEWKVVATFGDGQELLDAYEKDPFEFDVLITDVRMPVIDGLTLIKKMKELTSFSPMVISGFDDFAYLQTALREGALDYLIKPIDREEFKRQLENSKGKIMKKWQEQEELEIMKEQATELTYSKQIEKLSEVTKGVDIDVSIMDWTNGFPDGIYTLMHITINKPLRYSKSMSKDEYDTWILSHENILYELMAGYKQEYWKWRGDDSSFWLLLYEKNNRNKERLQTEVHEMASALQRNVSLYPFSNSIAISQIFSDLTLLPTVIEDLLELMKYRIIFGSHQILQQDIEEKLILEKSGTSIAGDLQHLIQRIIHSMERMNESELKQQVGLFAKALQSLRMPNEIELFVHSLSIQTIHYLIKHTPRLSDDLLDMQNTAKLMKNIGSFTELQAELEYWVMNVFQKLSVLNEKKVLDQVEVAKEWIKKNIKDSITIEKIAKRVYMNPTYFCEYFKNQTGETVLDFVTSTRINKARELLLTTNLKVYEIAEQVGYADTKYFSKLFKKHYGELPSKYKEKTRSK